MGACLNLAMPRADLADYLRTTEPTISRILTDLQTKKIIQRGSHGTLLLLNLAALEALASRQHAREIEGII